MSDIDTHALVRLLVRSGIIDPAEYVTVWKDCQGAGTIPTVGGMALEPTETDTFRYAVEAAMHQERP